MLRSARKRQRTARSLIAAGALFGHSANTIRVTLSRLASRGLIESPERGLYRLTRQTDALNQFVERWRLGEDRVRPWDGETWEFAHLQGDPKRSSWALGALGFREIRPALFARPSNLALAPEALRSLALSIDMDPAVLMITGRADDAADEWRAHWMPEALQEDTLSALERVRLSAQQLKEKPLDQAKLECFALGGEMIHRLAKDPLLPGTWIDTGPRAALVAAMRRYDQLGKAIWAAGKEDALRHMPRPQLTQERL